MRIRKRYVMLALASLTAFAVGGIASANHTTNNSTLAGSKVCRTTLNPCPAAFPKNTFVPASLFVHTGTVYAHPAQAALGGKAATVTLFFDDDGKLNLAGIPRCNRLTGQGAWNSGTTISQAWEQCGPGADGPGEVNAYMSPPNAVSGRASTSPPSNFGLCTLTFNGPVVGGNHTVVLFSRATTTPNSHPTCANPATNTQGNTTVLLQGTITNMPAASDFGNKLTVPNIDRAPLPLDDYTALTRRGSAITARCFDANRVLNSRGIFQYSGSGQPTDVVNHSQTCTVG